MFASPVGWTISWLSREGAFGRRRSRQFLRSGACGVGPQRGVDAAWAAAVLHSFSQGERGCSTPWSPTVRCATVSPNAPPKRDVLGTAMLSMLAGHRRYAHIAALRCDAVLPELLGMKRTVSEDAIRRAFKAIDEREGAVWLRRRLHDCVEPLLAEPWTSTSIRRSSRSMAIRKGRPCGLQSQEAGASEPLLPHLFDGLDASCSRCRRLSRATNMRPSHAAPSLWG